MLEYHAKLAADGRILIPATYRRKLQLRPGETIVLQLEEQELRLYSLKHSMLKAQALVKSHAKGKSLVEKLRILRSEDNKHE